MTAARRGAEVVTARLAGVLVGIFFRAVEVDGADHVAGSGPLAMVANHQNGLVDGLVLIATSPRYPRFLGKSTLWRILPLRPFLALAGVVAVYRRADTEGGMSDEARAGHNRDALARAGALLAGGGAIGIFPEGISHDRAALQDLRSGAARLALAAAEEGVPVVVQPVGIVYDDKTHFRSRVLVRFGPARTVVDRVDTYRADPGPTVRVLTAAIAGDLRAVGPDFDSVEDAERFVRLADAATGGAGASSLAERHRLARGLAVAAGDPARRSAVDDLDDVLGRYEAAVARARPDDAGWRAGRVPPDVASAGLSGVGVAVHAIPFIIITLVGDLAPNRGMRATVKLLGSFGLYTLTYVVLAATVGRRRGTRAGLLAFGAAPLSGWVALRTMEASEQRRVGGQTSAAALIAERLGIGAAVRSIVDGVALP